MDSQLAIPVVLVITFALWQRLRRSSALPLPPGPKKLPIVGNLFDMPRVQAGQTYLQWTKQYDSEVIHVDVAGQSMVMLNSYEATTELFERRSAMYSDRVIVPMAGDLMGWGEKITGLMPYGEPWKNHRKLFHRAVNETVVLSYHPQLLQNSRELLRNLLELPEKYEQHIRFSMAKFILSAAYGLDVSSPEHPLVELISRVNEVAVSALSPGKYLVDLLPILKHVPDWFPGAQFKRDAKLWREWTNDMIMKPFEAAKASLASGTAKPSIVSLNLAKGSEGPKMEKELAEAAATMYSAAVDTTTTTYLTFILTMTMYPDIQKRAQEELDRVLSPGQLPTFEDWNRLPYIHAILYEVLRWNPPLPTGVPHLNTVEDNFAGYRIPKNTIVFGNIWGILRDEKRFPNPDAFDPNRFMKDGKFHVESSAHDPTKNIFGYGRRLCPGRPLSLAAVWITMASILRVYDIKSTGEDKLKATGSLFMEDAITRSPLPFSCSIKPRSRAAVDMIVESALQTDN